MTSVRAATPADAAAIAGVHVRSWQAAYRGIVPDEVLDGLSLPDREQRWRSILRAQRRARASPSSPNATIASSGSARS